MSKAQKFPPTTLNGLTYQKKEAFTDIAITEYKSLFFFLNSSGGSSSSSIGLVKIMLRLKL